MFNNNTKNYKTLLTEKRARKQKLDNQKHRIKTQSDQDNTANLEKIL